ncbi:amidohydrolase [Bacillus tianshenii]|nr:amidohydrolase [Bacillus tianshenii]
MFKKLFENYEQLYSELVQFRRDLHMYPEVSHEEVETPKKIAAYLRKLGLEVREGVGGNGVVARLQGGKPGKTIALRADFDALPIQDEKEVAYKSRVPGVMHACGHDIHTASLLGVANVLSRYRDEIEGNVVFIHQFAEEVSPGGAEAMIADGCLEGVDEIYGAHVWSEDPVGQISFCEGFAMAAADIFEINVFGQGGHGAQPHKTIDPITASCQLVSNLQQIASRKTDPLKAVVVTVGAFQSGKALNVIPDKVYLGGTVRSFDEEVRDETEALIRKMTASTCDVFGAKAEVHYVRGHAAVYNHPTETKKVKTLAQHLFGKEHVIDKEPIMGAEDFGYYLQKVPGTFFFVGGRNPELNAVYSHHHPKFDVDEKAMINIGKTFLSIIFEKQIREQKEGAEQQIKN